VLSEHRALFPAHPGRLRIAGASVRCRAADAEEVVPVPAVEAEIEALPAEGRPADFAGLVGPVSWSASLTPERVVLGGSARLSVVVIGSGNTWLAPSPAPQLAAVPALEVFERPAELARDAGRELRWRRYLAFDLVPHRAGPLALPALRLPYFDPAARAYAEARLALPALDVREAPPEAAREAPAPAAPARPALDLARWRPAALAAALGALALAAAALRRGRRRGERAAPERDATSWLREARAAQARGDADAAAAAAERALRHALEGVPEGRWSRSAAALLARVERGRFAQGAERPSLDELEGLLAARPPSPGC
jgi:tetratricopeptide (TPR) repeat protein